MVVYSIWNLSRRRKHQIPYRSEDSIEAPDHPILGGVSLRDMIEMTTSGSGSGEFLFSPINLDTV
jgi:TGF-beta receptor type-1